MDGVGDEGVEEEAEVMDVVLAVEDVECGGSDDDVMELVAVKGGKGEVDDENDDQNWLQELY